MAGKSSGKAWMSRLSDTEYYRIVRKEDQKWPDVSKVFAFWYWGDQTLQCERTGIVTTKGEIESWRTAGLIERVNKDGTAWKDVSKKSKPELAPSV